MDKKNTPEVKLGQYKGLAVTRHVRPVTDKTVDIELVHQTRMHAVYHPTTEPARRGFRALLDFAGYMDGKEIPDSRMEKVMVVLGDGKLMPAAEQAIYGHRAGEVFRFDFTYPQDFRLPELSGKTAQFEIELRSLAEKVTPAPDEAFARSLGFDSLDALKADLRAKKQKIHEEGADRAAGKQLLDMAGANMTLDLPAEILDRTAQNEMKLLKERLSRSGITLEQHCKNSRTTPEALEKDYRAQAESRIRFVLAARAIAEAENIVVHPEEVNAEYRRLSQLQDTPEAEIRKALPEDTIAAALAAATAGRAQTVISYSTDGGAQALETGDIPQTVLDTATLEVSYRMEWLRRPDREKPMQDLLLLQAGGKVTKFFSYKTLQRDSLLRITPAEQVLANVGNFKGGLEAVVFQNYPAGEMTCTDKISRDNMLYTEPLPEIEWTLRDGTREVIGYDCRRATCRFRGRDYEAWYTEELPLATGPWKFHGLPGLILAVNDTGDDGGIIRFEATGIRRAEVPVTMADLNYLKTSRKKFLATERKFMTDPIGYMQANSNIRITVRNEDGTPRAGADLLREYKPLETE